MTRTALERIRGEGLIAIARGDFTVEELSRIAGALEQAGSHVMEVTLDSPGALEALTSLRKRYGAKMSIGAGTVRSADDVTRALEAGADFLVAPGLDPASAARAREKDALLVPGVFTASEVMAALREGLHLVKLFPCEPGGPTYLKSLRAPLRDVEFIPTGGVTFENARSYFQAGAKALGVGSSLVAPGVSGEEISVRAERFLEIAAESRRG